jgi:ribosomal protein S18 acetylase RimI-like enzyme
MTFHVDGRLDGRTLRLTYQFGDLRGEIDLVRVEEYTPAPITFRDRLKSRLDSVKRWLNARSRPSGEANARQLRVRGESLDSIIFRDAVAADIPALAELHVTTWNATYRTSRGPTVATRAWQWNQAFAKEGRRDFVLVLEDRNGRLIGFTWGRPHEGEFEGELSKIYLRWEYHGLGLGRRMMAETARRFLDRNIHSFILFAELSNPTLGFYDRMGGERLLDDRGQFGGAFGWRDVRALVV